MTFATGTGMRNGGETSHVEVVQAVAWKSMFANPFASSGVASVSLKVRWLSVSVTGTKVEYLLEMFHVTLV